MRFPTVEEVYCWLDEIRVDLLDPDNDSIEVRLYVEDNGNWRISWGDPCYDTDHTGFCQDDYIGWDTDVLELAESMLDGVKDSAVQAGEKIEAEDEDEEDEPEMCRFCRGDDNAPPRCECV